MDREEKEFLYLLRDMCFVIAQGDYSPLRALEELTIIGKVPKVISDLAESFSYMVLMIESKEHMLEIAHQKLKKQNTSLKNKVLELEIAIDKNQKMKEVKDIVETPFFKEIQEKSKKRRRK